MKPSGVALDIAATEFARCFAALNGKGTLIEAVNEFVARNSVTLQKIAVPLAVEKFLKAAETEGKSEEWQRNLAAVLNRFAGAFNVDVDAITPKLVSDHVAQLPFKERTKRNHRDIIGSFSRWLILSEYLPKDGSLLEGVQKYAHRKIGEITTYTPDEIRALLENASAEILPFLVLGAFAGLRHAEITRLKWEDIDLAEGFIEIKASTAQADQ